MTDTCLCEAHDVLALLIMKCADAERCGAGLPEPSALGATEVRLTTKSEYNMNDATDHTERRSAIGHRRQKATEQKPNQAEAAKVLLPQIEEKLSLARARQGEISRERTAVALAAHMGSARDRARLDELNHDGAILPAKSRD
jgi:hypothetical protein